MSLHTPFQNKRFRFAPLLALLTALLPGCGGQDFGNNSRSLGGDIGNGYNTSLASTNRSQNGRAGVERGAYPKLETSFKLPDLKGDPFDYENVNVQVTVRKPDNGTVDVPAFYDGDSTWRIRYTPTTPGTYAVVNVKLNRETVHEQGLDKKEWTVNGEPEPGFVRIDRGDHSRFQFDNGGRYYPIGHNQAWYSDKLPGTPDLFVKMHDAGENWSRVWMTHWDGKNLDWPASGKPAKFGDLDLTAARKWDTVVDAAEKNGIYFQMVVQHHGPYSSKSGYKYSSNTDSNWDQNPYNVKNGGFLTNPEDFFTDPKARALTKRKLYYMLSRWGYSSHILAFELFNEVENTDAWKGKLTESVALWHREMALFLHQFDPYRHLLTTSSANSVPLNSPVWETVDYIQVHTYPPDIITALSASDTPDKSAKKLDRPIFVGEFGPQDLKDTDGVALHQGLWASLMSGPSGAAQYWDWDEVEKNNLYGHFKAATAFVAASDLANHGGLQSVRLPVETAQRGTLRFAPGGGFSAAEQTDFVVGKSGAPAGMNRFPAYLQGQNHHDMMPHPLTLQVSYPADGALTVSVSKVAKAGAHLKVSVDGKAVERDFPAGAADSTPPSGDAVLKTDVTAGAHTVTIENTGTDWLVLQQIALTNYASALEAPARVGKDFLVAWLYPRDTAKGAETVTGKLTLTGLQAGRYRATWWDTYEGKSLDATDITVGKEPFTLETPPVNRDLALYVTQAGTPKETAKRKGKRPMAAQNAAPASPVSSTPTLSPATTSPTSGSPTSQKPATP